MNDGTVSGLHVVLPCGQGDGVPQGEADELKLAGMLHDIGRSASTATSWTARSLTDMSGNGCAGIRRWIPDPPFRTELRKDRRLDSDAPRAADDKGIPRSWDEMIPCLEDHRGRECLRLDDQSQRVSESKDHDQACMELVRCSGTQFDGDVVQAFLRLPWKAARAIRQEGGTADGKP
jgi:hypothetical protein